MTTPTYQTHHHPIQPLHHISISLITLDLFITVNYYYIKNLNNNKYH